MALLSGGPGQRGAEQGMRQGLVVGEEGELTTLQEETEVRTKEYAAMRSLSKAEYLDWLEESFLGEKGKRGPGATKTLLEDSTHVRVRSVNS